MDAVPGFPSRERGRGRGICWRYSQKAKVGVILTECVRPDRRHSPTVGNDCHAGWGR